MPVRRHALDALVDGLRGRPVEGVDWDRVIALANHTLLTPALFAALVRAGQIGRVPDDARAYLQFVHDSNRARNLRLRAQLFEAVAALNQQGIAPLLLKGAVALYLSPADAPPDRITSDLDIAVDPSELATAQAGLEALAYRPVDGFRGMGRPEDVGLLELRPTRDAAPPSAPVRVARDGVSALIPLPAARAEHWILHDLVKEGDYLRGRLDLRHLHDLARLSAEDGVDWGALRAALPDRACRDAFDTQMLAMQRLFGLAVPPACAARRRIRFHHWRRLFSARHPVAGAPLRVAGNLAWGARRLWRLAELAPRGPAEVSRRILRTAFQLRPRSKL